MASEHWIANQTMPDPTVACIMLTKDRPELAARAVRCFRAQTYQSKRLMIFDTGDACIPKGAQTNDTYVWIHPSYRNATIGKWRNDAISQSPGDIICHWDDDDYSHPNRIAEQVALLQSGDYDAVGYGEMLFWRNELFFCNKCGFSGWQREHACCDYHAYRINPGEAYLYSHGRRDYIIGTSLCYWRKTWEQKPFDNSLPNEACGEDHVFQSGLRLKSVTSLVQSGPARVVAIAEDGAPVVNLPCEPRMIATVHGGNTKIANYDYAMRRQNCFKRVPHWDARVRQILENA